MQKRFLKPELWSKSIGSVGSVYWGLKTGIIFNKHTDLIDYLGDIKMEKWKKRSELPVLKKLDLTVDVDRIREELQQFEAGKTWDGLGFDYMHMCETHTKLPKMFFNKEELEAVDNNVCELDWETASYQQLSIVEYDDTFDLSQREQQSGTVWDKRIAKNDPAADERWYRKVKADVPDYLREVYQMFPGAHRTRFARLAPHSNIKPHIDYDTQYGIRLHVAIETNDECFNGGWDKDGNEIKYHIPADGSVWFINPGYKHYAVNNGDTPRDHLIISIDSQDVLK